MSAPNLNSDYDPLEGPSTRIWKPKKKDLSGVPLGDMASYVNKFMDGLFALRAPKKPIPEKCSEQAASSDDEDVNENSPPSKFKSMRLDCERMETLRGMAKELGSRMTTDQRVACQLLYDLALKEDIFTSPQVNEEKMARMNEMVTELGAGMPAEQRATFGMMYTVAMQKIKKQPQQREEPRKDANEKKDFALD